MHRILVAAMALFLLCGVASANGSPAQQADIENARDTKARFTVTGLFYEENHWSAAVTWNWKYWDRARPTVSYLRLDDQLRSFQATWHGWHPSITPVLRNEGVWGFGFTFDIGKKR